MSSTPTTLSGFERSLALFAKIRPGEGKSIAVLFVYGFLLLLSYYLLKPLRESLLLTEFSAEVRSYAIAVIAVLLMFLVPLYGVLFRNTRISHLLQWITLFFIFNLLVFSFMWTGGMQIGFAYFVWVGIFGVMIVAQFWAFAADIFNLKSGQRVFPIIMVGATLGALAGAQLSKTLIPAYGPFVLLLLASVALFATLFLGNLARSAVPAESRSTPIVEKDNRLEHFLGGFAIVFSDHYLRLIALFVVLLNWINSTGEYIFAEMVVRYADDLAASDQSGLQKSDIIAAVYGDFLFWVTLLGLFLQTFVVSRIYQYMGLCKALLILPLLAVIGYGIVVFVPIFSIIRVVKILENSTDYSIMNTTRHALFLPTGRTAKYEGKTAIDTFFWRFGDLIQAGVIYAGASWLTLGIEHFAALNLMLSVVWVMVGIAIGREYHRIARRELSNLAPVLNRPIPDAALVEGGVFEHSFAADTFIDADPGDVLTLSAHLNDGNKLPGWLTFDVHRRLFRGIPPGQLDNDLIIKVIATDFDGLSAFGTFTIHQHP